MLLPIGLILPLSGDGLGTQYWYHETALDPINGRKVMVLVACFGRATASIMALGVSKAVPKAQEK